jgi:Leucine-rich repeat (LRR) protein
MYRPASLLLLLALSAPLAGCGQPVTVVQPAASSGDATSQPPESHPNDSVTSVPTPRPLEPQPGTAPTTAATTPRVDGASLPPITPLDGESQRAVAQRLEQALGSKLTGPPRTYKEEAGRIVLIALVDSVAGDDELAQLEGMNDLKTLLLSNSRVTSRGLVHLRGMQALQKLSLHRTGIDDSGLPYLEPLANLVELDLSYSQVTDAGLAALPELPKLQVLKLHATRLSDASVPLLKKRTGLKQLWLGDTQIGPDALRELKVALPNTRIR